MDSTRIEWNAEEDTYIVHILGKFAPKDFALRIDELQDLQSAIAAVLKRMQS